MKGKPSASSGQVKSKTKKENLSSSIVFEEMLFLTKHEILKENYETLKIDYASLEEKFKHVNEMKDLMKFHFENQTKELRSENEKHKKKIEEMKKTENELRIKNQELLIEKEKEEGEVKKIENKYKELTEKLGEVKKECSELRSLIEEAKNNVMNHVVTERFDVAEMDLKPYNGDGENLIGQEENNDMEQVEIKRTNLKSEHSKKFKTKKIFVGRLPCTITEGELKEFFSKYGTVVELEIIRDHETKKSRGFGFVNFDNEEVVDKLLSKGNMIDMGLTQVEIKKAKPKKSSNCSSPTPTSYGLIRSHGGSASTFALGYGYGRRGVSPEFGGGYRNVAPLGSSSRFGYGYGYDGGGSYESGGPYGRGYTRYHPYGR